MCIWSQLGSCLEKSPRQDRDCVEAKLWGGCRVLGVPALPSLCPGSQNIYKGWVWTEDGLGKGGAACCLTSEALMESGSRNCALNGWQKATCLGAGSKEVTLFAIVGTESPQVMTTAGLSSAEPSSHST